MNKSVGIDVVEIVTLGNIGEMIAIDCRDVGVLTIEISNIGYEFSLLQQVGTAGEVGDPGGSLLRPGFVAVEPLPERTEGQPRFPVQQRLMYGRSEEHTSELQSRFDL